MCDQSSICMPLTRQAGKQFQFWSGIIQKYEERNQSLLQEELELRRIVDELEASVPAFITFKLASLSEDDVDASEILRRPSTCKRSFKAHESKIPDMQNVSVFDMKKKDICCIDVIKRLANDEKEHVDNINKLIDKERALMKAKRNMDNVCQSGNRKVTVNMELLKQLNERLVENNKSLKSELPILRQQLQDMKDRVAPLQAEIDEERRKVEKLENPTIGEEDSATRTIASLRTKMQDNKIYMNDEAVRNKCLLSELEKLRGIVKELEQARRTKMCTEFCEKAVDKGLKSIISKLKCVC